MDVPNWVLLLFGRLLLNAELERLQLVARLAELERLLADETRGGKP
jgi:hypothetical protein